MFKLWLVEFYFNGGTQKIRKIINLRKTRQRGPIIIQLSIIIHLSHGLNTNSASDTDAFTRALQVCTGKTVPSICHFFFFSPRNPPPETNDRIIPPNDRHVLHRKRRRARYVIYDGMMMMLLYCFCAKGAYAFAVHWLPIILRDETKWWLTLVVLDNAARLTRSRIKRKSRYVPMCSPVRKSRYK